MAQRVRRAIPPAKSFCKSAGRCVRDPASYRGSVTHISARIHTRGQSFYRLRHARRHGVIFGRLLARHYARPDSFAPRSGPLRDTGSAIIPHVDCVF